MGTHLKMKGHCWYHCSVVTVGGQTLSIIPLAILTHGFCALLATLHSQGGCRELTHEGHAQERKKKKEKIFLLQESEICPRSTSSKVLLASHSLPEPSSLTYSQGRTQGAEPTSWEDPPHLLSW
jgi:hypothetical protein